MTGFIGRTDVNNVWRMTTYANAQRSGPDSGIRQRITDVDALRGFALLGILIVNISYFASGYPFHQVPDPAFSTELDHGVHAVVAFLFEMKFYLLFSFLFGYSFTLQMDSAQRRGVAFVPRFLRRLAGLLVLGGLHAVLLFYGDILTTYAILGLILLALRRIRLRTALITAGVLVGTVVLFFLVMALTAVPPVDEAAALVAGRQSTAALAGSPGSVIAEHLGSLPRMFGALIMVQAPVAMAMFLLGMAAGQRRLLADVPAHFRALRRIQLVGYPVGLGGAAAVVVLGGVNTMPGVALATLTGPLLAAAYAASMLRIFHTGPGQRLAAMLAPAGRMALSNYLGQSLICAMIFTGFGLGLIGTVPPAGVLLIAISIFAGQLVVSALWLRQYRYGPVEWLLRAVTNAQWPSWRVRRVAGADVTDGVPVGR
ncbi:DUF418 domain-containing protein [Micromonospora sonneratiae]